MLTRNNKGQTLVEYILLLSVAVSIVMTFYKSQVYKRLFGDQGQIGLQMKYQNEFAYRNAYQAKNDPSTGVNISRDNKNITNHPSYADNVDGTRFFGPREPYGN